MESNQICRLRTEKETINLNEKQHMNGIEYLQLMKLGRTYFPKYTNNSILKKIEKWQKI